MTHSLDVKNRKEWLEEALSLPVPERKPYEFLVSNAKELAKSHLPDEIREQLQQMNQPGGSTHMVVKNMPIDPDLPPTPTDGKRPASKRTWVSEAIILGTAAAANLEVLSYYEQKDGALIQDVAPVKGLEKSNSNASVNLFGYHSDDPILKRSFRTEVIILLGHRNEGQTATYFASLDDIINAMDSYYVDLLREPRYLVRTSESFNCYGRKIIYSEPRSVISKGPQGQDEIAVALYNAQIKDAEDEQAKMALNVLRSVLKPPVAKKIIIEPGDMLVFSNVRGLHSRDRIQGERWLQRGYFRQDLTELRRQTNSSETCRVFRSEELVLL